MILALIDMYLLLYNKLAALYKMPGSNSSNWQKVNMIYRTRSILKRRFIEVCLTKIIFLLDRYRLTKAPSDSTSIETPKMEIWAHGTLKVIAIIDLHGDGLECRFFIEDGLLKAREVPKH